MIKKKKKKYDLYGVKKDFPLIRPGDLVFVPK